MFIDAFFWARPSQNLYFNIENFGSSGQAVHYIFAAREVIVSLRIFGGSKGCRSHPSRSITTSRKQTSTMFQNNLRYFQN